MILTTEIIKQIDRENYYNVLTAFDQQMTDAVAIAKTAVTALLSDYETLSPERITNVVICGMGGSAIAGDFVRNIFIDNFTLPIIICRDYTVPAFVNRQSLVIISSYSGNTEETISAYEDAVSHDALTIAISTGGFIQQMSESMNRPIIRIPSGYQPRQAIAYSLVIMYTLLHQLFLKTWPEEALKEAVEHIQTKKSLYPFLQKTNPLIDIANKIAHQPVMIYASEQMLATALRFKGQISENAKLLAFANTIVEMNHNEIVGWETIELDSLNNFSVILLRDRDDHIQVQKRFDIITEILSKKSQVFEFWSEGNSRFVRYISLIYLTDWLSFYMAILRKQDPTPVEIINYLKQQLASR